MRLSPGEVLREKEIAELFRSSRTPVREACLRLAQEYLLDVRPQSGTYVEPIRLSRIWDAQFLRVAVETAAVRKLAPEFDLSAHTWLLDNMADLARAANQENRDKFRVLDEEFHAGLVAAAGHENVWRMVSDAMAHLDRVRSLMIPKGDHMRNVTAEHQAVVDALKSGDPARASDAMLAHLGLLPAMVAKLVEASPELFVVDADLPDTE